MTAENKGLQLCWSCANQVMEAITLGHQVSKDPGTTQEMVNPIWTLALDFAQQNHKWHAAGHREGYPVHIVVWDSTDNLAQDVQSLEDGIRTAFSPDSNKPK